MKESLDEAKQELKRADHLIYVSLKYTRTVDIFRHIIQRLVNSYDFAIDALLKLAKKKKKVKDIPSNIGLKYNLLKETFPEDNFLKESIDFYCMLRKILRAKYTKAREFRRHVTMTASTDEGDIEVNIDIIHEYYSKAKEFVAYAEIMIEGKKQE